MSKKIIGVTVGSSLPKPNFKQTDPTKGDYIKNKPDFEGLKERVDTVATELSKKANSSELGTLAKKNTVEKTDLDADIQNSLAKADSALQSYTETDPTVPAWAKQPTKPIYTATEVGADPSGSSNTALENAKVYTDEKVAIAIADKEQLAPEFANSVEECTDTSKVYVLPDGYIYAYMLSTGPAYTNLSTTVHENYRMGSSGALSALDGAVTTDFIPVKRGQTVRFKGFDPSTMPSSKFPYICFYTAADESATVTSGYVWGRLDTLIAEGQLPESNGVYTYTAFVSGNSSSANGARGQHEAASTITHIRLCGAMIDGEEIIVTVDEEITEDSGDGYAWQNTGHAFVPTDYEDRILNLESAVSEKVDADEMPSALKCPFALTINGVQYDGSEAVEINISGNDISNETTNSENLFSFEDADESFSWITGDTEDMIYATSTDYGYKDATNLQFVSKKSGSNGRFAVTGGLPVLSSGNYIASAEVYLPSANSSLKTVQFGACVIPSNKSQYESVTLSSYDTWSTVTKTFTVAEGDVATYIALMGTGADYEVYWRNIKVVSADTLEDISGTDYDGNILKGKKWVACGDSFTANGYNASDGFDESVYIYQDGRFAGRYKVYPHIIGLRNNMNIVNLATGGQTMANSSNSFMTRYANIDADADYITIMLGINDKIQGISVGAIDSTDTATFCGAFNVAMEHILENHPFAHIGIMVSHGTNEEIMEVTRKIAERWGVPYLDYGSSQVPLMNRYTGRNVCAKAQEIREKNFCVASDGTSATNAHPNTAAHEYESTFIEAWLRTL